MAVRVVSAREGRRGGLGEDASNAVGEGDLLAGERGVGLGVEGVRTGGPDRVEALFLGKGP